MINTDMIQSLDFGIFSADPDFRNSRIFENMSPGIAGLFREGITAPSPVAVTPFSQNSSFKNFQSFMNNEETEEKKW